ncbi:MAG: STAS domain-containing protein [Planctomycetota bacterium]
MPEMKSDGYVRVDAYGILDGRSRDALEFQAILDRDKGEIDTHYIIDLTEAQYINSNTMGLMVRFLSAVQAQGYRLVLLVREGSIRNVLTMTGLAELMPVVASREEARAILGLPAKPGLPLARDVNYTRLSSEIEQIILGGEKVAAEIRSQDSELNKLLGGAAST